MQKHRDLCPDEAKSAGLPKRVYDMGTHLSLHFSFARFLKLDENTECSKTRTFRRQCTAKDWSQVQALIDLIQVDGRPTANAPTSSTIAPVPTSSTAVPTSSTASPATTLQIPSCFAKNHQDTTPSKSATKIEDVVTPEKLEIPKVFREPVSMTYLLNKFGSTSAPSSARSSAMSTCSDLSKQSCATTVMYDSDGFPLDESENDEEKEKKKAAACPATSLLSRYIKGAARKRLAKKAAAAAKKAAAKKAATEKKTTASALAPTTKTRDFDPIHKSRLSLGSQRGELTGITVNGERVHVKTLLLSVDKDFELHLKEIKDIIDQKQMSKHDALKACGYL